MEEKKSTHCYNKKFKVTLINMITNLKSERHNINKKN